MNLRILKKLSKRAAPLLERLGDSREQFPAEKDESYIGITLITARKHFERIRAAHPDCSRQLEFKTPAADGNGWISHRPPSHPRKGTIMVGGMSGYYEPEWDEETAWDSLSTLVAHHFTDWSKAAMTDTTPELTIKLRTPSQVLAAAARIIAGDPGPT